MSCDNQISTQNLIDAKSDAVTLGEVATSRLGAEAAGTPITESTNRFGETTDTVQGRLNKLGVIFDDPIRDWSASLLVSDLRAHRYPATTGDVYIPIKSLPFTTGGVFNTDDWVLYAGYDDYLSINDTSRTHSFSSVSDMQSSTLVFPLNKPLRVVGENDKYTNYIVVNTPSDVPLTAGFWAEKLDSISDNVDKIRGAFENQVKTATGGVPDVGSYIYIEGDSIGEGTFSSNFATDSWAALVRSAINKKYGTTNQGFVSVRNVAPSTNFHEITKSGFGLDVFNGGLFGGVFNNSVTSGDYIEFKYIGRSFQVVYDQLPGNGTFEIRIDGTLIETVNSDSTENRGVIGTRHTPNEFYKTEHVIRITNITNFSVNILGIVYQDGYDLQQPTVMNVSRSTLSAVELTENMIDKYSTSGAQILALGVNDSLLSTDVAIFKTRIQRFCQNNLNVGGKTLMLDCMFNESANDNEYKRVLREVAVEFSVNVTRIDFAEEWLGDEDKNIDAQLVDVDTVHPTPHGQRRIADAVLSWLGYSSNDSEQFITKRVTYSVKAGVAMGANERIQLNLSDVVGGTDQNKGAWVNSDSVQIRAEVLNAGIWHNSGWDSRDANIYGVRAHIFGVQTVGIGSSEDLIVVQTGIHGCLSSDGPFSGGTQGAVGGDKVSLPVRLVITRG